MPACVSEGVCTVFVRLFYISSEVGWAKSPVTVVIADDREILTDGKLLLLACENGSLQGFGLHSRKKASDFFDLSSIYVGICWL